MPTLPSTGLRQEGSGIRGQPVDLQHPCLLLRERAIARERFFKGNGIEMLTEVSSPLVFKFYPGHRVLMTGDLVVGTANYLQLPRDHVGVCHASGGSYEWCL